MAARRAVEKGRSVGLIEGKKVRRNPQNEEISGGRKNGVGKGGGSAIHRRKTSKGSIGVKERKQEKVIN